jgi:hypothetical protein
MISKIAGGKNSRLDSSHRTHEHRLDSGSTLPECIRNRQGGHEVSPGAAPGDQDAARRRGRGATGQSNGKGINHVRARLTALLSVAFRGLALAFPPPRCPAVPLPPSRVPSDPLRGDFP